MKILGIDSSGLVASVAVVEDGVLLGEYTTNYKKTHSQTLLPMLDEVKKMIELDLNTVDAIAISAGPGSFTGLRIGSATAKGLGLALNKPLVEVPTLEGLAYNLYGCEAVVCPIMDARRNQVYNALFEIREGRPCRLTEDRAISVEALLSELSSNDWKPFLVGDGSLLCRDAFEKAGFNCALAPENIRMQSAWGVAMAAMEKKPISGELLQPVYLRLSQAERERQARLQEHETI